MNKTIITRGEDQYLDKLEESVKAYKKGKEEMPVLLTQGKALYEDDKFKTVISKEITDRDGEVVKVEGINTKNYESNPVLLDAHNMQGSVVTTVLGKVVNLIKTKAVDGVNELLGELVFANTPNAQMAKSLVQEGFVKTVSMGFGVRDYDHASKTINESELYEVSLVSVPANVGALIGKSFNIEQPNDLIKRLKNYQDIKPKIKEYRNFFLSKEITDLLGYEKTGNELIDMKAIYNSIIKELQEPEPIVETQQEEPEAETQPEEKQEETEVIRVTPQQLSEIIADAMREAKLV